ncbi:MAG: DUF4350 domain-containing protein [Tannerella sp.]|jgi:hypothetical protein|nr:DUF4350 domain-containing protein [Tannerella sp.]
MKKNILFALFICCAQLGAQQIPDRSFDPPVVSPAYPFGKGSLVLLDEAHHNFHTAEGRYLVFAEILKKDGYRVMSGTQAFTPALPKEVKILVIANALNAINADGNDGRTRWKLPVPSAFTADEIRSVNEWVKAGGSLFLIADHHPFPGASFDLAKSFGFTFYNGFATDTLSDSYPYRVSGVALFSKKDGSLAIHPLTENVEQVATFTGQAFQIPEKATSLLTLGKQYKLLLPDTAWVFGQHTQRLPAKGFSQGAVLEYGKGRVAIFGEAAMFSGQLKGQEQEPMGLNAPFAGDNIPFLLNMIHWLDYDKK